MLATLYVAGAATLYNAPISLYVFRRNGLADLAQPMRQMEEPDNKPIITEGARDGSVRGRVGAFLYVLYDFHQSARTDDWNVDRKAF